MSIDEKALVDAIFKAKEEYALWDDADPKLWPLVINTAITTYLDAAKEPVSDQPVEETAIRVARMAYEAGWLHAHRANMKGQQDCWEYDLPAIKANIRLVLPMREISGWRPASEKPVGSEGPYLCHCVEAPGSKNSAKPFQVAAWFGVWNVPGDIEVTHWMSLPQPPENARRGSDD